MNHSQAGKENIAKGGGGGTPGTPGIGGGGGGGAPAAPGTGEGGISGISGFGGCGASATSETAGGEQVASWPGGGGELSSSDVECFSSINWVGGGADDEPEAGRGERDFSSLSGICKITVHESK